MNKKTLAKNLKSAVEEMIKTDFSGWFRWELDDNLAVWLGWGDGFDENDEYAIHSKSQPSYCLCAKVAENNPTSDYGYAYMPWREDDGEVYDTEITISPNEDYETLADNLLYSYEELKPLLENGEYTL